MSSCTAVIGFLSSQTNQSICLESVWTLPPPQGQNLFVYPSQRRYDNLRTDTEAVS